MDKEKLSLDDAEKVTGGSQYKCGECGYEFDEGNGVSGDECPNCHGHWIGQRMDWMNGDPPWCSQIEE